MRPALLGVLGVLVFADAGPVAALGFFGTIVVLFAIGFVEGRLRAVAWTAMLVASAFVADVLWQLELAPHGDRLEVDVGDALGPASSAARASTNVTCARDGISQPCSRR